MLPFVKNYLLAQDEPQINNMFRVIVGGDPLGSFLKVSGIGYSVEPYELKEGVEIQHHISNLLVVQENIMK